tara:strand:+ start:258 stop:644 length:387 start_codon:yes stop_codon:yes gene_type:complete
MSEQQQQEIIDALYAALYNLIERKLIVDTEGDHMEEIAEAMTKARGDIEDYLEYYIHCPVCHNASVVYHNAWCGATCLAADCDAHIPNPRPSKGSELSRIERAEYELHNAKLAMARSKRILGDKNREL